MRYETATPGALLIAAATHADPLRSRAALEERCRRAEAEVDRLTTGLCSLLLHDSERFGRVGVPNIVRLLFGEPMPWRKP